MTPGRKTTSTRRQWLTESFQLAGIFSLASATGCQIFHKRKCVELDLEYLNAFDSFSYYLSPAFLERPPKRILALWSRGASVGEEIQVQFTELMSNQIRQARIAEVVLDKRNSSCLCDLDAILKGRFSEYRLLEMTQQYNADSLMITRINSINNVWPLNVAATVVLIDRFDAIVMMAADGHWDLSVPDVHVAYRSFVKNFSGNPAPQLLEAHLRSPRQLQSFIAWQIATAMKEHLPG